MAAMGMKC